MIKEFKLHYKNRTFIALSLECSAICFGGTNPALQPPAVSMIQCTFNFNRVGVGVLQFYGTFLEYSEGFLLLIQYMNSN